MSGDNSELELDVPKSNPASDARLLSDEFLLELSCGTMTVLTVYKLGFLAARRTYVLVYPCHDDALYLCSAIYGTYTSASDL